VRNDVVQLMRDLGPLLVEDLALPCFMPGLREGELGAQRRGPVLPVAQPARRQPRQGPPTAGGRATPGLATKVKGAAGTAPVS
jgi:hypothetical protein